MNDLTIYWMEKNAGKASLLLGGLKGLANILFKKGFGKAGEVVSNLTVPQKMFSKNWLKAQFDPRAIAKTTYESIKNPMGSLAHQFGIDTPATRSFLGKLQQSSLPHLSEHASTSLQNIRKIRDMKGGELALNAIPAVLFGAPSVYSGLKTINSVNQGKKGVFEGLGDLATEASFWTGGPGFHAPIVSEALSSLQPGKKLDTLLGLSRTPGIRSVPPTGLPLRYSPDFSPSRLSTSSPSYIQR